MYDAFVGLRSTDPRDSKTASHYSLGTLGWSDGSTRGIVRVVTSVETVVVGCGTSISRSRYRIRRVVENPATNRGVISRVALSFSCITHTGCTL